MAQAFVDDETLQGVRSRYPFLEHGVHLWETPRKFEQFLEKILSGARLGNRAFVPRFPDCRKPSFPLVRFDNPVSLENRCILVKIEDITWSQMQPFSNCPWNRYLSFAGKRCLHYINVRANSKEIKYDFSIHPYNL